MKTRILQAAILLPFLFAAYSVLGQDTAGTTKSGIPPSKSLTESGSTEEAGQTGDVKYWTLRECIEYAQENSIQIQRQRLSTEEAEIARQQARLNYIPSLNAGVSSGTNLGTHIIGDTSVKNPVSLSMSANLGTDLFSGLRKYRQTELAALNLDASLLALADLKNEIELNVAAAYLTILFSEENVTIAGSQLNTLSMQVEQTEKLVNAGRNTYSDLLQLQAQLAEAKRQELDAQNQRRLAYFNLCQLLEIEDYVNFKITIPDYVLSFIDLEQANTDDIFKAAQSMPHVQYAKLNIDIAKKNIQIAKSGYYPTLSLSAGYGSSYSGTPSLVTSNPASYAVVPFNEQIKNNAVASISLNLSIPIFNSLQVRNSVRVQTIAARRAFYDLALVEKQLNTDIQQALINAEGARDQYNASEINVRMTQEVFRIIEHKFNLGNAVPTDYSIALSDYIASRSNLSRAKYDYIFKSKILDFYRGIPIDL